MVNSAVAADWNSDGKNDVIAFDGKVLLLLARLEVAHSARISSWPFP